MNALLPLLIVFLFGIIASAACSVVVVGVLRLLRLVPQSDVEIAATALLAYAPVRRASTVFARAATALASFILPFSVSVALGLAAVLPNSALKPAASLLREEAKETPITTTAKLIDVGHPPDVWGAFGEVERDIKIAYRYKPMQQLTLCNALMANSADRFIKLLQRSRSAYSTETNEQVVELRGFNGAISYNELEQLYSELAKSWEPIAKEAEHENDSAELLAKVRSTLDQLTS